jgi:hypothetical protein
MEHSSWQLWGLFFLLFATLNVKADFLAEDAEAFNMDIMKLAGRETMLLFGR